MSRVFTKHELNIIEDMKGAGCNFGIALSMLKGGSKMARKGWNGKGMYVEYQVPDEHSKMTLPYFYINYPNGDKCPWLASQTDLAREDWYPVKVGE